jgi:uncharacterized membrane protein YfcA
LPDSISTELATISVFQWRLRHCQVIPPEVDAAYSYGGAPGGIRWYRWPEHSGVSWAKSRIPVGAALCGGQQGSVIASRSDVNLPLILIVLIVVAMVVAIAWNASGRRDDAKRSQEVLEEVVADRPPVFLRMYSGHRQTDTNPQFQSEAGWLSELGYQPISHTWAAGEWGLADFLVAALLTPLFGIGLVVFAYMWTVRPNGTLSVLFAQAATSSRPSL